MPFVHYVPFVVKKPSPKQIPLRNLKVLRGSALNQNPITYYPLPN